MATSPFGTSTIQRQLHSAWQKRQQEEACRQTTGKACLTAFEVRSRLRGSLNEKLSQRDREKIAYALHLEINRLEQGQGFMTSKLMIESGLARAGDPKPTKRLRELTYEPDESEEANRKRRACLYKGYTSYLQLIRGILAVTREDPNVVCGRIFEGTSFTGLETDINRNRRLARGLELSIARVNSLVSQCGPRRNLEQLFAETAARKEQVQKSGGLANWPFFDGDESHWPNGNELPNWENPYWSGFSSNAAFATDFIQSGSEVLVRATSLDWEGAALFLPRVYLGCAIWFKSWLLEGEEHEQYLGALLQAQSRISEVRCLDGGDRSVRYRGADERFALQAARDSLTDGTGQCWLVIYPSPGGRGLCPMLYWCQGEGGVLVCVLNEETIDVLSTMYVCVDAQNVENLFERVQRLIGGDLCQLEIEWMRTAFDLLDNPLLRTATPPILAGEPFS